MKIVAKTLCGLALAVSIVAPSAALAQTTPNPNPNPTPTPTPAPTATEAAAHAFDFEFGDWKCHLSRRLKPLTGSNNWVDYDGTSVVRPWWSGKANVGELLVEGPAGRIEGMSVRVYNRATGQWGISYASAAGGAVGLPMFGGFKGDRGEFYAQDTFNDRAIFVRFVFSDITAKSFQLEQAFSDDGGKTWEANWIAKFTR